MNSDRIYSVVVPIFHRATKGRMGGGRRRYYEAVPVPPGRVLFLGDSISGGGLWEDLFPELATSNRGIGGDTTSDLLDRLDSAIVDPVAVSLLIGTNDLHGTRSGRDTAQIAERADAIVGRIRAQAPTADIFVHSVLPRTAFFADRIRALNERYREIAARHGATYVDLWPRFADASGAIRPELTRDNLHLSPAGYLAWTEVLRPHLAPYAIKERT